MTNNIGRQKYSPLKCFCRNSAVCWKLCWVLLCGMQQKPWKNMFATVLELSRPITFIWYCLICLAQYLKHVAFWNKMIFQFSRWEFKHMWTTRNKEKLKGIYNPFLSSDEWGKKKATRDRFPFATFETCFFPPPPPLWSYPIFPPKRENCVPALLKIRFTAEQNKRLFFTSFAPPLSWNTHALKFNRVSNTDSAKKAVCSTL